MPSRSTSGNTQHFLLHSYTVGDRFDLGAHHRLPPHVPLMSPFAGLVLCRLIGHSFICRMDFCSLDPLFALLHGFLFWILSSLCRMDFLFFGSSLRNIACFCLLILYACLPVCTGVRKLFPPQGVF